MVSIGASAGAACKDMGRVFKDTTTGIEGKWTSTTGRAKKFARSTVKGAQNLLHLRSPSKEAKVTAKAAPLTIQVDAGASDPATQDDPVPMSTPEEIPALAAAPQGSIENYSNHTAQVVRPDNVSQVPNSTSATKESEENQAAATATSSPSTGPAAPSLGERVMAASRRGLKEFEETIATKTSWAKLQLKKLLFGKPAKSSAAAAAGGEVVEGVGAAAAVELPVGSEGEVEVQEAAAAAPAEAVKPQRSFLGRKVHCAAKRCREAREGVKRGVASVCLGAKEGMQALKQRCSRGGSKGSQ